MSAARRARVGVMVLGMMGAALVVAPSGQAAEPCGPDIDAFTSIDSDARADTVVGLPEYDGGRGAIDVHYSGGTSRLYRASDLGLTASVPGDRFGSAVTVRDLNGDGCAEVVAGAPGRAGGGGVYVLKGGASGLMTSGNTVIGNPTGQAGAGFGSAVAIVSSFYDEAAGQALWVGAPKQDIGSAVDAGQLVRYPVSAAGALGAPAQFSQDSLGFADTAEAGDQFGSVLAADDHLTLMVGTPLEDVGSAKDAGAMAYVKATGGSFGSVQYTQNSTGVPGTAEAGDRFGASVVQFDAVGVPGEDIGSAKDTGSVQLFGYGDHKPGTSLSQNAAGIPSSDHSGDAFGSALATGTGTACQEVDSLAIGAPGKDVGSAKDTGQVTFYQRADCANRVVNQNTSGVPGANETGDRFGATLATLLDGPYQEEDTTDRVMAGAPGENQGSVVDAGSVTTMMLNSGYGRKVTATVQTGGPQANQRFGQVIATPGGTYN